MKRQNSLPEIFFPRGSAVLLRAVLTALGFVILSPSALAAESVKVQTFQTHSRLTVKIDENTPLKWKAQSGGFELFLSGVALTDLGAPLGDEERWKARFSSIKDPRISSLRFTESPEGVKIEGKWKFPEGAQALADPKMETFDFREKEPAQFVVDLWLRKGPTLAESTAIRRRRELEAQLRQAEAEAKRRAERRLANVKKKAEANDVSKFCREPLNEKSDLFLQFMPFHQPVDFSQWIPQNTADSQFPYFEPKAKSREAQFVRLALNLYKQGKPGLVVRTLEFFDSEYPRSAFKWEMRFLHANALIKLNLHDAAEKMLMRLMADAKEVPVALHSAMFLAGKYFERKSYLQSLETFLWLVNHFPEHRLSWVFHLGAAESFYALKQTERAQKEYQWVAENAQSPKEKAEGALRFGDIYQDRWQYEQALGAYAESLTRFKKEAADFPAIHINRAEALYGLGQFDRAKEAFEAFVKEYPGHPAGWRATYRLGEIYGRKPVQQFSAEARKWYYETVNSYPFSPGATLARLRLVECGDHGGFTPESAAWFFSEEAEEFDGKGAVALTRYPELRGLAHVRSLITWDEEEEAIDVAIHEIRANRSIDFRRTMTGIFEVLFERNIDRLLAEGRKYDALKFYSEKSQYVTRETNDSDPEYLLRLSQAASDLGLGKLGLELAETYRKVSGTGRLGRVLASERSKEDALEIRLKQSEQAFAEAKAIWISVGAEGAGRLKELFALVADESRYSYEKHLILGLLAEKQKQEATALAHAIQAQLSIPHGTPIDQVIRVEAWLADLQFRAGDLRTSLELYKNLEKRALLAAKAAPAPERKVATEAEESETEEESRIQTVDTADLLGVPSAPSLDGILMAQAHVLEKEGRWGDAAATYSRAVEEGKGGNQAMYGYARALLKTGASSDQEKARGILQKVTESKTNDYWKKLAGETLANERSRDITKNDAKEGRK